MFATPKGSSRLKKAALEVALLALAVALAIPAGRFAARFYETHRSHSKTGDYSLQLQGKPHPISLYGTSTCPACRKAREYLASLDVQFNDLYVDRAEATQSEFAGLGENRVPILLSRQRIVVGFHPEEMGEVVAGEMKLVAGQ